MQAWIHDLGDIILVTYKGVEQPARVTGYVDSLDNTKPLYVNLRVSDGGRWGERRIKIQPDQIIKPLPNWKQEQHAKWEAELAQHVQEAWAKMSEADKRQVHKDAVALGFVPERDTRSPIERMIDQAVGRES